METVSKQYSATGSAFNGVTFDSARPICQHEDYHTALGCCRYWVRWLLKGVAVGEYPTTNGVEWRTFDDILVVSMHEDARKGA